MLSVLYLTLMIGFIKCYFAMKMQRFKTEHSSTLWHEETARKQNATQTGCVFITEVIPRPKWFYLHVGKDDVRCRKTTSLTHYAPRQECSKWIDTFRQYCRKPYLSVDKDQYCLSLPNYVTGRNLKLCKIEMAS